VRAVVTDSIGEIDARDWNALVGELYPFLRHEFLLAAEKSGCVSPDAGWSPRHIALVDDRENLVGAMPLYEKTHSWGEFVFDWSWAQAYQQAGLDYYPKLVSAAPFTPAPSGRLFVSQEELRPVLVQAALASGRVGSEAQEGLSISLAQSRLSFFRRIPRRLQFQETKESTARPPSRQGGGYPLPLADRSRTG
jgi:predicted N-acyltransferase